MREISLTTDLARQLKTLYADMEASYERVATRLGFSCDGCPDNCCDSYFQHHTYIEWAYIWNGLRTLSSEKQALFLERAAEYVKISQEMVDRHERPSLMCPLNEEGLCGLYSHRLMICRLHGVPSMLARPDGRRLEFPGCFRCQELTAGLSSFHGLERTGFYQRLIGLEIVFLGEYRRFLPKVDLTLAQMLDYGFPTFSNR